MVAESSRRKTKISIKNIIKRFAVLALGLGAVVWLAHETGIEVVKESMLTIVPVFPVLILLEGFRIGFEALATYTLLLQMGGKVPLLPLVRSSLISYSVCIVLPAGRTLGEALRGAILTPFVGSGRATTLATMNQVLTLFSNAVMAILATVTAIYGYGWSELTAVLLGYAVITCGLALCIQVIARLSRFGKLLIRLLPRYKETISSFCSYTKECGYLPVLPSMAMIMSRISQVLQFGVLGLVLGLGLNLDSTFLSQGINLIGSAVGDLIPSQLGTIDGAFVRFSPYLGTTGAVGLSIAVTVHCIQLCCVALGSLISLFIDTRNSTTYNILQTTKSNPGLIPKQARSATTIAKST